MIKRGWERGARRSLLTGLWVIVCSIHFAGCDNGGAPPRIPEDSLFTFSPLASELTLPSNGFRDFEVITTPPVPAEVSWTLDNRLIGIGPNLRFFPPELGEMELRASAQFEDKAAQCTWLLTVTNDHLFEFQFVPADQQQDLVELETREFRVASQWPFYREITWFHHGQPAGTDSTYQYLAEVEGVDSLRVHVLADGQLFTRNWQLNVAQYRPPAVQVILVQNDQVGGSINVIWRRVNPVVHPVTGYLVGVSYAGPITEANWDQAQLLGLFEHQDEEIWLRQNFTEPDDGIIPGAEAWFAVRTVGVQGILSAVDISVQHTIAENWWIAGTIADEMGQPLSGVELTDDQLLYSVVSQADGSYRIGPFGTNHTVVLQTHTSDLDAFTDPITAWHDYRTSALNSEQYSQLDLRLLSRYGCDQECETNGTSFLTFFRYLTRTSLTTVMRPNQNLYKWDHYPLAVYIPEFSSGGIDFQANCSATLDMWNSLMGEDYFLQTANPETADVVFLFDDLGTQANGQTSLLLPNGENYLLGDVIPEKMQVYIHNTISVAQRVQETSLHELGHVLGLNRHILCSQPSYLMYVTASGCLDNGYENAVHIDEKRTVKTIRYLPQGYDMGGF